MRSTRLPILAVIVATVALVPADFSVTAAPIRCADLVGAYAVPGAAAQVTEASMIAAGDGKPERCDVRGTIAPAVRFRLELPTTTFNGRYLQRGCFGFCGRLEEPAAPDCGPSSTGDFAVATTDDGHVLESAATQGIFGRDNQAARDDWFFRAPHVVSKVSKQLITAFYGAPPVRSYFSGCSNGGREGLLLAQRYPHDFDGIIAGDPVNYLGPLGGVSETWRARTNLRSDGSPVLTDEKLPALHRAVLGACDALDGLTDGQIDDPRACRFDPVTLACPPGVDDPNCLTSQQVTVTRALYSGPTDAHGRLLYVGGQPYGSELAWAGFITPRPGFGTSLAGSVADNYLRYVGYPIGTPHSSVAEFAFTEAELRRLTAEGARGNAMRLDLTEFRDAGGKLLLWHGWADQDLPPVATVDYYHRMAQRMGGLDATQPWARLFMVPAMYHCADGYSLTEFEPFTALIDWVEHGTAPDRIIAAGRDGYGAITRTRPVFPHPLVAAYDGDGSVDDAANFAPALPSAPLPDTIDWLGTYLHDVPGPVADG
ncbi:tannase/feruloyl esterase family alpha/beta hydrolase [Nocardia cyriacigeorgica]|uniref:Tannase/feruloyl esterase family alpha/beta hydrolase n=1 Tax=Nocardia cyriacigeorgica TaxID=135487 RepID=A0A6P1D8D8_9NOCA|nr:tannase/feruloyl esterase family alpha/beta hydrolase [Nocardia cyriacigeorgica]NEW46727.1 tannase/feruloyl esterase family alpha/beta hydrolase [Nocardia cyriacigeorgica]